MASLKVKKMQFDRKGFLKLFDEFAGDSAQAIGEIFLRKTRSRIPRDTGNLQDTQKMDKIEQLKTKVKSYVGSDERKRTGAPYAPHVFYPGITRRYAGNNWIDPVIPEIERASKSRITNMAIQFVNTNK